MQYQKNLQTHNLPVYMINSNMEINELDDYLDGDKNVGFLKKIKDGLYIGIIKNADIKAYKKIKISRFYPREELLSKKEGNHLFVMIPMKILQKKEIIINCINNKMKLLSSWNIIGEDQYQIFFNNRGKCLIKLLTENKIVIEVIRQLLHGDNWDDIVSDDFVGQNEALTCLWYDENR